MSLAKEGDASRVRALNLAAAMADVVEGFLCLGVSGPGVGCTGSFLVGIPVGAKGVSSPPTSLDRAGIGEASIRARF